MNEEQKIQTERREQEETSTARRAQILGMPYADMRNIEQTLTLLKEVLPLQVMHRDYVVPLTPGSGGTPWQFGVTTQTPQSFAREITKQYNDKGRNIQLILISNSAYRQLMLRYDPPKKVIYDDIKISKEGDSDTISAVTQTLRTVGTDDIFNYLLNQADKLGASDIHIENQRTNIRVRMRIDGVLHQVADLDKDRYRIILGALASRAGISTASSESQSGHMQTEITRGGVTHVLNLRVEAIPTLYGMDSVLRLFNFDQSMLSLDRLSLGEREKARIKEIISHPRGMVLMVGPTGSGKSTTLYSIINALNSTTRKIITLEDPIEFGIDGVSQIPVHTDAGGSFANGLRSVLRLDPDVVMIGEIRDNDTARTAIQASITGHLVMSSFHANSASAAFSRMIDMIGVNPVFSSAIRLVIAQRLVRRLDDNTKQSYVPDEATKKWVRTIMQGVPQEANMPDISGDFKLWKPVITKDSPFGFKGRTVIMEQLVVDEAIQKFLRGDVAETNMETIEDTARQEGMITLLQNGVLAALRGETTLDEVNKAI